MRLEEPEFEKNDEWYYNDTNNELYKEDGLYCPRLTDKAPLKAVDSYLEYCTAFYQFNLHYIPEFVYEEYNKAMERLNEVTNKK